MMDNTASDEAKENFIEEVSLTAFILTTTLKTRAP